MATDGTGSITAVSVITSNSVSTTEETTANNDETTAYDDHTVHTLATTTTTIVLTGTPANGDITVSTQPSSNTDNDTTTTTVTTNIGANTPLAVTAPSSSSSTVAYNSAGSADTASQKTSTIPAKSASLTGDNTVVGGSWSSWTKLNPTSGSTASGVFKELTSTLPIGNTIVTTPGDQGAISDTSNSRALGIGLGVGLASFALLIIVVVLLVIRKKRKCCWKRSVAYSHTGMDFALPPKSTKSLARSDVSVPPTYLQNLSTDPSDISADILSSHHGARQSVTPIDLGNSEFNSTASFKYEPFAKSNANMSIDELEETRLE